MMWKLVEDPVALKHWKLMQTLLSLDRPMVFIPISLSCTNTTVSHMTGRVARSRCIACDNERCPVRGPSWNSIYIDRITIRFD